MIRCPIRPNATIMSIDPFSGPDAWRHAFAEGLERQLQQPTLGSFILVLANASYDEGLWQSLWPALNRRFGELADTLVETFARGRRPDHPQDDLLVFLELMALGLGRLHLTRTRRAGPWLLQHIPLRALRPARMSAARITSLQAPFDPEGFHFDRPFLRPERLWAGDWRGHRLELFYNKFPFAPGHALLVPEPAAHRPQYLDRATHQLAWAWLEAVGARLPGSGLGYNSRGANASVNHLHLQFYTGQEPPLPIEAPDLVHNGGATPWPLPVQRFNHPDQAWAAIEACHHSNQPYNLLYRPGCLYLTPRAFQGQVPTPAWSPGPAWAEFAGLITLSDEEDFLNLQPDAVAALLAAHAP